MTIGYITVDFAGSYMEAKDYAKQLTTKLDAATTGTNGITVQRPPDDVEFPEVRVYVNGPNDVPVITEVLHKDGWERGSQMLWLYGSQSLGSRELAKHLFGDYGNVITKAVRP